MHRVLSGLWMFVVIVVASVPAQAGPYLAKTYPGSMCRPMNDGIHAPSNPTNFAYQASGILSNTSTTAPLNLVCPVIRNELWTPSGIYGSGTSVLVVNPSKVEATCFLSSNSYYGTGWVVQGVQDATASGSYKWIRFKDTPNNFLGGNYNFWCHLPPGTSASKLSGIFQYFFEELP
jgi:hypothetical protein